MLKPLIFISALTVSTLAFAEPSALLTHNTTDLESNAFFGDTPSPYPVAPNSDFSVEWKKVKSVCYLHNWSYKPCTATVKMKDGLNHLTVGDLTMDLTTGGLLPLLSTNNGFTLIVNGPAEVTVSRV